MKVFLYRELLVCYLVCFLVLNRGERGQNLWILLRCLGKSELDSYFRGVIVSLCLSHYSYRQKGEVLLFWGLKGPTEYIVLTRGESG